MAGGLIVADAAWAGEGGGPEGTQHSMCCACGAGDQAGVCTSTHTRGQGAGQGLCFCTQCAGASAGLAAVLSPSIMWAWIISCSSTSFRSLDGRSCTQRRGGEPRAQGGRCAQQPQEGSLSGRALLCRLFSLQLPSWCYLHTLSSGSDSLILQESAATQRSSTALFKAPGGALSMGSGHLDALGSCICGRQPPPPR